MPISALARSSCNSKNILKQQDRAARRLSGPVFLRREIRKNDLFSASSPSQSRIDRQIIPTFWLCHFPQPGEICQRQNLWQNWELCRTAKASHFEERLSLVGERWRVSDRVGNVALRSNDGEGKAADNQILPRSDTELVSATAPYCYTESVKSHSSQNLENLPVFCRNLSLKWQL